jgi:hypothetical protein
MLFSTIFAVPIDYRSLDPPLNAAGKILTQNHSKDHL